MRQPVTRRIKPFSDYLLLVLAAVLAYLPVSSMAYALKNDVIGLEYPIKYFISQCLHNGVVPFWFNTWALGFPLESIITWSVHSPLQLLFGALFKYNLYTLHIEFIFYIAMSGCTMFYFLKKHVTHNHSLAWMMACCYMLSGFNVGSSQWMLYITASVFIPLIVSLLFDLLKKPGWKSSLLFSVVFYTMLTSVYVAFNIVTVYLLAGITLFYLLRKWFLYRQALKENVIFLSHAAIITSLLCAPALVSSIALVQHIGRGAPLAVETDFFNSNYLPLKGLSSFLVPLSSIRMKAFNTEGTMLHTYLGMLPLLLLPLAFARQLKEKKIFGLVALLAAIFFLMLALGNTTPVRNWLTVLPGFSYFRNAALFRIFFIFFILIFIAVQSNLLGFQKQNAKYLWITSSMLLVSLLIVLFLNTNSITHIDLSSGLKNIVQNINLEQALFISAFIQLFFLLLFISFYKRKSSRTLTVLVASELIINTLLCTPYFAVSSYSVKEVSAILNSKPGFPIQQNFVNNIRVADTTNGAIFFHQNVYQKEVSAQNAYWGPLVLKGFTPITDETANTARFQHQVLYIDSSGEDQTLKLLAQKPIYVSAYVQTNKPVRVRFLQNHYAGWAAFYNEKKIALTKVENGMEIMVPASGNIEFRYQKTGSWILILLINTIVFSTVGYFLFRKVKRTFRSFSPSLPHQ